MYWGVVLSFCSFPASARENTSPKCRPKVSLSHSECQHWLPVAYRKNYRLWKTLVCPPSAFLAMPPATPYHVVHLETPEMSSCPLGMSHICACARDPAISLGPSPNLCTWKSYPPFQAPAPESHASSGTLILGLFSHNHHLLLHAHPET